MIMVFLIILDKLILKWNLKKKKKNLLRLLFENISQGRFLVCYLPYEKMNEN